MSGNAWETPLPYRQRRLFLEQFEKDLEFFKLFFLLANKSRVIRHMGVLWSREGPAAEMGLHNVVGTEQAIQQSPCARYVSCDKNVDPEFCSLVSGFRTHEEESCGVSDRAAEKRCRETGRTQIYTCHAGLVDIAVPVISDGHYIATLLCGQVLRQAPTAESFAGTLARLRHLAYIDPERLRDAYFRVPVSAEEEIQAAARLMEVFAEHLATAWSRLANLVRDQHRAIREQALWRQEFARTILDGAAERNELREMLARLEFRNLPNRVLVLELEPGAGGNPAGALQVVEEIGDDLEDFSPAYLRKQGVCVFFHDPPNSRARALADRILRTLSAGRGIRARVGVGGRRDDLRTLAESYEEALAALGGSHSPVAVFQPRVESSGGLPAASERLCELLAARSLISARQAASGLPLVALASLGPDDADAHRRAFRSMLYAVAAAVRKIGMDPDTVRRFLDESETGMDASSSVVEVHEAFRRAIAGLVDRSAELYSGRANRLVERACRLIEERIQGPEPAYRIAPAEIASRLGISVSHLSRTFKQVTGSTFERTVMQRRVELARKLLLDPALNVSQVAARCGFADAAYFARVFHSVAGCAPSQYMRDPMRHAGSAD